MEDVNDTHPQRERSVSYGHTQSAARSMPPAETSASYNYPPHANTPIQHSWQPPPQPTFENAGHRPHPSEVHHPPPPYHSQQSYPPPSRDGPGYPPDHAYSRQGSISAPTRSPADAPQAQFHAVNGNAPNGHYYPSHGPPEYRPQHPYGPPPDDSVNGSQSQSGLQIVTGPDMMSGQTPGPHPGHYGPPSAGGPQTPNYQQGYYHDPYNQRRKPVRAAQACDSCRQRKAKCDEGRPECQHCKDNGLKCSYRDIPPQKQEKQVIAITEKLENLDSRFYQSQEEMRQLFSSQDEKMNRLMELVTQTMNSNDQRATQPGVPKDPPGSGGSRLKREISQSTGPNLNTNTSFTSAHDNSEASTVGSAHADFSMPPDHKTAAQNLLAWPSLQSMIPKNHNPSYVMDLESNRGLLRLYGSGEGEDKNDGGEGAASPAGSCSSGGRLEDEMSTPSPGGVWGCGQLPPPSPGQVGREHAGGVSPHGGLVLESKVVDELFKSYVENMHKLHPFLDQRVLKNMKNLFKKRYSWDLRTHAGPATGKRKREAEFSGDVYEVRSAHHLNKINGPQPGKPIEIEHSIANAIVLLVMALGKICAHKEPLPNAPSPSAVPTSTPQHTYSESPMSLSAPNSPFRPGGPTSMAIGPTNPQGKNIDVIPGLAYFAAAADILGELPGGTDVSHVQANLLAGLFMGQLARVFASHYYISNAARACMVLIDSTAYKNKTMSHPRRNLINFAFWSCLQLESDILAEVELPQSGITRYEGRMHREMPTGVTLETVDNEADAVLRFYSYQVQLRRTLNDIHTSLYRNKPSMQKPSFSLIDALNTNLEEWRQGILKEWRWDDDQHMSNNVNVARMRGKYYGAKYIIYRPALYYALVKSGTFQMQLPSESPHGQGYSSQLQSPAMGNPPATAHFARGSEMGPPLRSGESSRSGERLEEDVLKAAKICIAAAIRSTTAFDAVPARLILTNIFGTMHAQFGNILVLAATHTSPNHELSSLVAEGTMRELLDRTIRTLKMSESISPVLRYDAEILDTIRTNLFRPSTSAASSFSTM